LDFAVLDEAAYMDSRLWWDVVRPMLLENQGGAVFISTPNGRNWFWELYQLALADETGEWATFHYTSLDNPLIPNSEFDVVKSHSPERVWRQEYLAEFIEDAGAVFRGVRDVATAPSDVQPDSSHAYVMGVDWGRDNDYTVLSVMDVMTGNMVALERFNQIDWAHQRGRIRAVYDKWKPTLILAESNSIGSVNIEALQGDGLPVRSFTTTSQSKTVLIQGLALAIERGDIRLLDDETLVHELLAYQIERMPSGNYRYNAPSGMHDDTVIATALAVHALNTGGVSVGFV